MTQNQIGRGSQDAFAQYMHGARGQGIGLMGTGLQGQQAALQSYGQGVGLMGQGAGLYGQAVGGMSDSFSQAGALQAQGVDALGQVAQGGLLGAQMQQGMDENMANAYMGNVNAHNARRGANMSMAGSILGGFLGSDKKIKENIELVGTSPKGYNIYEFDYKDKSYGEGRYRGVMAQEVPEASININGTLMVNYDKLDVDFERIS